MSDISLLMAGVLTAGPASVPKKLSVQSPIQSERVGQKSTQESSSTFPDADLTPPEFLQVDHSIDTARSYINKKYQSTLYKVKEKLQSKNTHTLPESTDLRIVAAVPDEPDMRAEFSPSVDDISSPDALESDDPMTQVIPVSQLDDVQPSDWAFGALQSIGERYGCVNYAGKTYSGNRAISRYEFAAGLEACLQQIDELITSNRDNTIEPEDLILLQRLQAEVKEELAQLQQKVTGIQGKTNEIAANQFSTTTRLFGQAIFSIQGTNSNDVDLFPRDGVPERQGRTNLTFNNSVQLTLATSFTGRDLLLTGLSAGNLGSNASSVFTNMGRLGFESNTDNNLVINDLSYRFALSDNLGVVVGTAGVNPVNTFRGINPLEGSGDGAISLFGQRNPILAIGNGTGGIGFDWQISDRISLQGIYSSEIPSFPGNNRLGGLFGGRFTVGTQLTLAPTNNLDIGIHYLYSHSPDDLLGTGIGDAQLISPFADSTAFNTHAVGATVAWRVNPNFQLGAWGGYSVSHPENLSGSVDITNWMLFAAFPNLLRSGNLGGILVGQPPKITSSTLPDGFNFPNFSEGGTPGGRRDTSLHIEMFYRAQLTEHLALTPGFLVVLNPDHNAANDSLFVGTLRATFRF
ncbi:iron uptake porin [Nostoc sp. PCC 7524]|uniref:iron uptake porin n=1 Tax=Nostoc sp. (strain ATCC 29411 / PCC 7524) TaxID=28072 RepID=UPI00059FD4A1|nr:iron uptake porin [Nostoc sp. PCC 7524]